MDKGTEEVTKIFDKKMNEEVFDMNKEGWQPIDTVKSNPIENVPGTGVDYEVRPNDGVPMLDSEGEDLLKDNN